MRNVLRAGGALILIVVLIVAWFFINILVGMHSSGRVDGTISGLALRAPVSIARDGRGVPHIVAQNEHDLFYAQGYAEGSDRLFQMDLLRRYVRGDLAEVFGSAALQADEEARAVPIRAMVDGQWNALDANQREILGAFSDGVNAAMDREPLPVEFRMLAYKPAPWTPDDSLVVSMATVLDLIDDWNEVARRDRAYRKGGLAGLAARFPFTDPCYDAPVTGGLAAMGPGPACTKRFALLGELGDTRRPLGSNEWAAGAGHTSTGRALLANDPHLGLRIPGVWYLLDLRAPGFHAAGASLPGSPGIVLGHNDRIAWAATNGTVATLSVFNAPANLGRFRVADRNVSRSPARRRDEAILSRAQRVRTHDRRRPLRHGALGCVSTPRLTVAGISRPQSRDVAGRRGQGARRISRADAKLRARRDERTRRLSASRRNSQRSRMGALDSSERRFDAQLRQRSVRRIAEGCAVARRDRVDRQ